MNAKNRKLIIDQIDAKLKAYKEAANLPNPAKGWIYGIRTALNITLKQLAGKLNIKPPTLKNFENRELEGTISLRSLRHIAEAFDMKLVYAIVPREGTLIDLIDRKAEEKAREIVSRTSQTMILEDQENEKDRLMKAVLEKKTELKNEIPKFLWD